MIRYFGFRFTSG